MRLTAVRAKYGLSAAVTHSARVARLLMPSCQRGAAPSRKRAAATALSVPGTLISRAGAKNAVNSQNCVFVHLSNGWLWHWAHSILMPRKSRAVLPARFSGRFSFAEKNAAGDSASVGEPLPGV